MNADLASYPAGTVAPEWQAGDFLLTTCLEPWYSRNGAVDAAIREGERIDLWRRRKDITPDQRKAWSSRSHAVAISQDEVGTVHLVEALAKGVQRSVIDKYEPVEYLYVHTDLTQAQRDDFVEYVEGMVGVKYGFFTDVGVGFNMATGLKMSFGRTDHVICSGLVAAALGIYRWRSDPSHVTPAMLAEYHNVSTWA